MLLMKDRSFLYERRAYLIYAKVGERGFLYELRPYLIYLKVGEMKFPMILFLLYSCSYFVNKIELVCIFLVLYIFKKF